MPKDIYNNIHNFIHDSQMLETTQVFNECRIDKIKFCYIHIMNMVQK